MWGFIQMQIDISQKNKKKKKKKQKQTNLPTSQWHTKDGPLFQKLQYFWALTLRKLLGFTLTWCADNLKLYVPDCNRIIPKSTSLECIFSKYPKVFANSDPQFPYILRAFLSTKIMK